MPKLYDNIATLTEDELIEIAKLNSWTVGEVLSNYTKQIKIVRVFEELDDNGDIERWAIDCGKSKEYIVDLLINNYDKPANLKVYSNLSGVSARCTISIENKRLYLVLDVSNGKKLESRILFLENLLYNRLI